MPPIFVELDLVLTRVSTLAESVWGALVTRPGSIFRLLGEFARHGKGRFKEALDAVFTPDPQTLPYNTELLEYLRVQKREGRRIYLATSATREVARLVSQHLDLFDDVIAFDANSDRRADGKLSAMAALAGSREFCYVGLAPQSARIWKACGSAVVVAASSRSAQEIEALCHVERVFVKPPVPVSTYLRAVRSHQWVKNILLFVPVLPGLSQMTGARFLAVGIGFCAFCLCSSSFYIVNDLLDLPADRQHPSKRTRPLAAGALSARRGAWLALGLLTGGLVLAAWVSPQFLAATAAYLIGTAVYSLGGKGLVVLDVLILAGLYALRVAAGAVAAQLRLSFWMLAFSVAFFLSLAFVKRFSELQALAMRGKELPAGRDYRAADMPLIEMFGTGAGLVSVLMLALYIDQDAARMSFRHPFVLGALCPTLLYWIFRVWLQAHRGLMHEDPVVFAITDRVSRYVLVFAGAIIAAADFL